MTSAAASSRDQPQARLAWVDIARALGIIAVVVWHTAGGIVRSGIAAPAGTAHIVDAWDAYAYRAMPIFFLVSGLFVLGSLRRSSGDFVANKARTLLWPYLLWSTISLAVGTVAGSASNYGVTLADLPELLYNPPLQYWFLYALLAMMLGFLALTRLGLPPLAILVITAVAYVVVAGTDLTAPSYIVTQIGLLAVYFAFGAAARASILGSVSRTSSAVLVTIGLLAAAVVGVIVVAAPLPGPRWLPFVAATAGMLAIVCLSEAISHLGGALAAGLIAIGRVSLQIYLAQILFASGTRVVLSRLGVGDFTIHLVLGTLAGFIGPLLLVWISNRLRIQLLWAWPERGQDGGVEPEMVGSRPA